MAQRTQYYPSGLPWAYDRTLDHPDLQHRKYNGKEFVEMHGYDTNDIVWRQYYPAIGRFQTPDPEVENDYDLSPYTMCDNNMVLKTDPDGRQAQIAFEAYDLYKFYKYTRYAAAVGTGVAAGAGTVVVYNHFVSGDKSKEVFQALMQAANTTTNNKSKSNVKTNTKSVATAAPSPNNLKHDDNKNKVKRESSAKSRAKWEKANGEKWPKDTENSTKNQDVSHKKPLADGGTNNVDNIKPQPHKEHIEEHKQNGDFKRWGARKNN